MGLRILTVLAILILGAVLVVMVLNAAPGMWR